MSLNQTQNDVLVEIYNYGVTNNYTNEQIQIAINVAYIESSLGVNLTNPSSTASGLYQYLDGTWNIYHQGLGEKNNQTNQIQAFYNDLSKYTNWYFDPATNMNIPNDMSLGQYTYIKHHDGISYSDFQNSPGLGI